MSNEKQRNEKGQFVKGITPQGAVPFNEGTAKEMQARSAEARKRNRTLAEVLRAQLQEKASEGSPLTKLEYLTLKAITNHAKGAMEFKDLRDLQKLLGEDIKTVNLGGDAPVNIVLGDEKAVEGLKRALATGAKPRDPEEGEEE